MELSGLYFRDRTDIFIITAYIDGFMREFAQIMRRRGKNVIFWCNDDSIDDRHVMRVGRISRFYFMQE